MTAIALEVFGAVTNRSPATVAKRPRPVGTSATSKLLTTRLDPERTVLWTGITPIGSIAVVLTETDFKVSVESLSKARVPEPTAPARELILVARRCVGNPRLPTLFKRRPSASISGSEGSR